ncbi:hypothetical protein AUJ14_00530 [Candidatus Micrarchaeota archaeon CG1_02_55_22]|nr:MAG: hypothetical protein AUJ14_00530 [Candidatus Micrarchaeota archaeon CG1_02_55_22]
MARRQVPVEYAAKPFPTIRYAWRRYVRDPWLHMWQTRIIPQYRDEAIIRNARLNRLYYDLKGSYIGERDEYARGGVRRGILEGLLNDDPDINSYAQRLVKDMLITNLRRIGVNGQNLNGRATNLSELELEQVYSLYNRIETQSALQNRAISQGGALTYTDTLGVEVDANGIVDGYGTPTAAGTLPGPVKAVFLEPSHFLDQGNFDTSRGSELARSLFTSKAVTDVIEAYWKGSGQNLAQTLTARRGAIMATAKKALMPDAVSQEKLPIGTTGKQMEVARNIVNALKANRTDLDHYFWRIRNNCDHSMLWELGAQVRLLQDMATRWPDYYFKPAGAAPDFMQKRDNSRNMIFQQLLQANLDWEDPAKLQEQVKHMAARMQYPTDARENRIVQMAMDLAQLPLLRQTLSSASRDEAVRMRGQRGERFNMPLTEVVALDNAQRARGQAPTPAAQGDQKQAA